MPEPPASASRPTDTPALLRTCPAETWAPGSPVSRRPGISRRLSRFAARGLGDALLLGDEGLGLGGVAHGVGRDLAVAHGRQRLVHVVAAVLAVADAAVEGVVAAPEPEPARLLGDRRGDE